MMSAPLDCIPAKTPQSFSLPEARQLVQDLYAPNPLIYWLDFGLTAITGHAAMLTGALLPYWLPEPVAPRIALQAVCVLISILCYYRASIFIHEVVHLRPGTFNGFRLLYHALFGIPCFLPSFVYYTHIGHHRSHYGTKQDAEYIPLEMRSRWIIVLFVLQSFLAPLAGVGRFLILSPLGWLIPPLRRRIIERRSSLVFDLFFLRSQPSQRVWRIITIQEAALFVWIVGGIIALNTVLRPWAGSLLLHFYLGLAGAALINSLRTLTSHRWAGDHEEMSWEEQLLDSTNFPNRAWLDELWAPVGERFHATHHLFPTMPYHNLGIAHRRLVANLPADSIYRQCDRDSFFGELWDLWRRAGTRRQKTPARAVAA
jgi:fatty acid desaturase